MNFFFRFIRGYFQISFFSPDASRILNFLLEKNVPAWGIKGGEDRVSFCIFGGHIKFLEPFFKTLSENEKIEQKKRGTLRILELFGARWGFFAGLIFFCFSLLLSTQFLWGVEVTGNDKIYAEDIKKDLKTYGIAPGVGISSFDPKEVGMRYQISSDAFVYVNINLIGTKAFVEVREREVVDKTEKEEMPSNLVADIYGTIERYEVLSGQIQVKRGERVTAGQLLIGGVKESAAGTFRALRAKGRVFARTQRSFQVTIPFEEVKKVYTGVEKEKITLEFLGLKFPLPFITPPEEEVFEKMQSVEEMTLFNRRLPVRIYRLSFLETEEKKEPIILDRARDLAYDKYEEFKRDTFAPDDEILAENLSLEEGPQGLTLTAELTLIEDICKEIPFSVY